MAVLALGFYIGIFLPIENLGASIPEGEVSGGEQPASVYYDEHWKATEAYVSTESGYKSMDPSAGMDSVICGKISVFPIATSFGPADVPQTTLEPDMVMTKWNVHGHIHFE